MSVFLNAALDDGPVASVAPGPRPVHASAPPSPVTTAGSDRPGPPESPDPSRAVREFEAICAKHSLACGAPEDLTAFLRALDDNKLLAMNFWSVVARVSAGKDGAALTQQETLAAIVRAVTGQPIEQVRESGEAQREQVDQLARMLAGEDVPLTPTQTAPPPSQSAAAQSQPLAPLGHDTQSPDPPTGLRSPVTQLHLASTPRAAAGSEAISPADESAPRLPSTTRARLVLQPDHPRHIAPAASARPEMTIIAREAAPDAAPEAAPVASRHSETGSTRLRVEPEDEPRIAIPLSAYAERDDKGALGRRAAIVAVGLIILCGFAFLIARGVAAWRQPGNQAREGLSSLTHRLAALVHPSSTPPASATPASGAGPTVAPSPPNASAASPPVIAPQAATSNNSTLAPATPNARDSAPAPASAPSPQPSEARHEGFDRHPRESIERPMNEAAFGDDSALVQVPANEMRDHLISSRFPILPDTANADSVTGVVTLHAVITARGTVEHAYAISGPDNLRQPAIDAVAGWRYRPYLLNGTPVDVSTTIRVDFAGND